MIEKIEFSDINKFLASLGLICIGLAFFLPWFFNHDVSILLLEKDKIEKLTPTAKIIILDQQKALMMINQTVPWVSGILILIGIVLLIYSIKLWKKRQTVLDKIQDEELKSKEFQNLSKQEKRELIENELDNADVNSGVIVLKNEGERQAEIDNYIQIENSIYAKLSEAYKVNFSLSQNVKIGSYYYDIILKSKNLATFKDRIVEIKFFRQQLTVEQLKDAASQLIIASKEYQKSFKRNTLPILIVIYHEKEFDETIKLLRKQIREYSQELGKPIRTNFFSKSEIENVRSMQILMNQAYKLTTNSGLTK